jgi:hypothetical protein
MATIASVPREGGSWSRRGEEILETLDMAIYMEGPWRCL